MFSEFSNRSIKDLLNLYPNLQNQLQQQLICLRGLAETPAQQKLVQRLEKIVNDSGLHGPAEGDLESHWEETRRLLEDLYSQKNISHEQHGQLRSLQYQIAQEWDLLNGEFDPGDPEHARSVLIFIVSLVMMLLLQAC